MNKFCCVLLGCCGDDGGFVVFIVDVKCVDWSYVIK